MGHRWSEVVLLVLVLGRTWLEVGCIRWLEVGSCRCLYWDVESWK